MGKRKYLIIIALFSYIILITSGTYAYLYTSSKNSNLAGNMATANLDLKVTRVTPSESSGTSNLVPLLDAALKNALKGNGGVSSCVDANRNVSCEVYKITIHNTGSSNLKLSGFITLVASGQDNIYNNLKWELIENATTRKTEYVTNNMEKSVIEKNFTIQSNETKDYYIALWISENGRDQRQTDTGVYGGLIEFNTSNGLGTTATFGEFDSDYCTNNKITKLSDCILITDKYATNVSTAKANIEKRVANFNETAPIYMDDGSINLSNSGIYMAEDDYGKSYYFRGKIDNNYVSFAGFIWRIVRINGDGSIRMIYSGTSTTDTGEKTSIGTSAFNNDPYDPAMVGYKYGLDKTYQETTATNLNYGNIDANTIYYFADSYTKNDTTKKLSLSGNLTSGTLENVWGSNNSTYKYTCFSTSSTGTCTTLVEIASYVSSTQVKVKTYHSYLSKSYESTYTDEHDSTIKTKIDAWYKTNIQDKGYSTYLTDNLFCNDRSISSGDGFSLNQTTFYGAYNRNVDHKTPSYKCPRQKDQFTTSSGTTLGNGELTYPVGLLTADEVAYAGGKYGYDNKEYYLATGQYYWLASPSHFTSGNADAHGWSVYSSAGYLSPWLWVSYSWIGVRPVISLNANTLISQGNGTTSNPYIVKVD
mgnify:FL=1